MDLLSPITSVGIIEDPTRCPPTFDVVLRSTDRREDGDLWRDGFFQNKITRYLCFSRTPNKHRDDEQLLLTDVCIVNEKDPLPDGFVSIERTLDTLERASKKKLICVRYETRANVSEAVCDVILLSKAKRAPPPHTLVGEINGLVVCYKTCPITASSNQQPLQDEEEEKETPTYSSATLFINAMYGVPFQLNSSLSETLPKMLDHREMEQKYNTPLNLSSDFEYSFRLEHSLIQQSVRSCLHPT